jgi:predicted small secreted protein
MKGSFIMRRKHSWLIVPAFMGFIGAALLVGCGDTNPEGSPPSGGTVEGIKDKASDLAKSAVEKSGKVVEGAGQAVEKAGQNLQETAKDTVKEKLGDKASQAVDGTGKAVEKAGQSIENAGQKIQDSVNKP